MAHPPPSPISTLGLVLAASSFTLLAPAVRSLALAAHYGRPLPRPQARPYCPLPHTPGHYCRRVEVAMANLELTLASRSLHRSHTPFHFHQPNEAKKKRHFFIREARQVSIGGEEMRSEGSTSPNGACAVCGGAAAVYCGADAAALCVPCDAAVHAANLLASRHERVPLAVAVMASSGVYDGLFAPAEDEGGSAASSSWATTTPAQGQGQGSPNSSSSSFSNGTGDDDTSLFDLLSDVNLMAGAAAGAVLSPDVVALPHGAASSAPFWLQHSLAAGASAWTSWPPSSEAVVVPSAAVAAAADREARVRRYREKRKNRRFQKTIRYASRKAYAEARPRVKGRFVKRAAASGGGGADSNDDDDDTAAAADGANKFWLSFSDDGAGFHHAAAYGVVPSCF